MPANPVTKAMNGVALPADCLGEKPYVWLVRIL